MCSRGYAAGTTNHIADEAGVRWEQWAPVPADERLRDLAKYKATDLAAFVRELGLPADSTRRADSEAALLAYAADHAVGEDWLRFARELASRLPRPLPFNGNITDPNKTAKAALEARYRVHVENRRGIRVIANAPRIAGDEQQIADAHRMSAQQVGLNAEKVAVPARVLQ